MFQSAKCNTLQFDSTYIRLIRHDCSRMSRASLLENMLRSIILGQPHLMAVLWQVDCLHHNTHTRAPLLPGLKQSPSFLIPGPSLIYSTTTQSVRVFSTTLSTESLNFSTVATLSGERPRSDSPQPPPGGPAWKVQPQQRALCRERARTSYGRVLQPVGVLVAFGSERVRESTMLSRDLRHRLPKAGCGGVSSAQGLHSG